MADTLAKLMAMQGDLMKVLGVEIPTYGYLLQAPQLISSAIDLTTEAAEVLDAISVVYKPWKKQPAHVVEPHLREEVIDVLFLWMELCLIMRIEPDDVVNLYEQKFYANLCRIIEAKDANQNQKDAAQVLLDRYKATWAEE